MAAAAQIDSGVRIRATPYARRLARERGLSLLKIAGSGPNGRISAIDLSSARPTANVADGSPSPVPRDAPALRMGATGAPSAIAATVEFRAMGALLGQIQALHSGIAREDICLKAAALALDPVASDAGGADIVLLDASRRQVLAGVAQASLSSVAALRLRPEDRSTGGGLAISFLGHAGVRPVAAQLGGAGMRLVVGLGDAADCLLSYDPLRISDEAAERFLVTFRELVETPIRLLV